MNGLSGNCRQIPAFVLKKRVVFLEDRFSVAAMLKLAYKTKRKRVERKENLKLYVKNVDEKDIYSQNVEVPQF